VHAVVATTFLPFHRPRPLRVATPPRGEGLRFPAVRVDYRGRRSTDAPPNVKHRTTKGIA